MVRDTLSERARIRIKEEMHAREISQRDLADELTRRTGERWTQSRVGKILTGRVALQVDELALIAHCVGVSVVETIRDRGLEFWAEMTPTEVRMLDSLRRRANFKRAVLAMLDLPDEPRTATMVGTKKRGGDRPHSLKDKARDADTPT